MGKRKTAFHVIACLVLLFVTASLQAQQRTLTGSVAEDKTNTPLEGATVSIRQTGVNTITKADGTFSIQAPAGSVTLTVSFVGHQTETVSVGSNQTSVAVKLSTTTNTQMSDVVVVGYQRQTLRKTTSAVSVVQSRDIENLPAPSFDQLLQGKVAGVNIQNFSGEPGVRNTFVVRGNTTIVTNFNQGYNAQGTSTLDLARSMSTPLYVVDGFPITITDLDAVSSTNTNYLAGINVNDIESIVVQKDAAATAVWGSRGANGVVVIKTKRGRVGKPQFRVSYYTGIVQRPELQYTLLGAEERRQKLDLIRLYAPHQDLRFVNNLPQILTDSLNPAFRGATDWQNLFYQNGTVNNADVSVSGGTEQLNYRVAMNYYDETGIVKQTGFSRYAVRGNFDFKISPKVTSAFSLSLAHLDRKPGLGRGRYDVTPITAYSMPSSLYKLSAADSAFYNGTYTNIRDKNTQDQVNANFQLDYNIVKGIQYSFRGGAALTLDDRDRFQPAEIAPNNRAFVESNKNKFYQYYLANVLTFSKSVNATHNLDFVLTQSLDYKEYNQNQAGGYNPPANIQTVSGIRQADLYGYSDFEQAGLASFLAQGSYDYKGRYILNAAIRADGSSRFGENNKWGYFPTVSLAWILSDENFMKGISWINMLKLRGSYGLSGTEPDDFYAPYNVWSFNGSYNGVTTATPSFQKPITLKNLTWNKSNQLDVGMDLYTFNNRLNVTLDLYRRYSLNPILDFPFPFFTGYSNLKYNAPVKILNEGVDLQITSRNLRPGNKLQWTTNFNISYNKNRLAALPNGNRTFFTDSYAYNNGNTHSLIFQVGQPIYRWAQMLYDGVYTSEEQIPVNPVTGQKVTYFKGNRTVRVGDPIWRDINGDYDVWSDEDRGEQYGDLVPTGDPNPKFTGGLYNEFSYKNFSVGVLCTYTLGRDIINTLAADEFANIWSFGDINTLGANRLPDLRNIHYWTPADLEKGAASGVNFPSLSPFGNSYYQFLPFSTMWNESGDYLRISSITLGYTLPKKVLNRVKVSNLRFYSIFNNVHIFQKAHVPDAELVTPQGDYNGAAYPLPKKITLGFEVTF